MEQAIGSRSVTAHEGARAAEADPAFAQDWDNATWIARLRGQGAEGEQALSALRDYLRRSVYVYLLRNRGDLAGLDPDELFQLAEDFTQEALLIVLRELDGFRGDSKLTTWAYRIVVNLAIGKLRRKHWRDLSLEHTLEDRSGQSLLERLADTGSADPESALVQQQVLERVRQVIAESLTERQRRVLTGIVLEEASTEDMADRLGTNRNNIYKILHDARKKLRGCLEEMGVSAQQALTSVADGASLWAVGEGSFLDEALVGAD